MNTIIMLFLISLLILVHEIGHFAAARMFGVRVSKFGFGLPIGPTLFKTKWGNTEILVHAFLLGGYVSFPDDEEVKEKEAKKKAEDLIKQLEEGANFEELAKEHSDDTGTKDDGGLIDYFNKDSNMDESFLKA